MMKPNDFFPLIVNTIETNPKFTKTPKEGKRKEKKQQYSGFTLKINNGVTQKVDLDSSYSDISKKI